MNAPIIPLPVKRTHTCSRCSKTGHNAATCQATLRPIPEPDADTPLDGLVDILLRHRGYAGLANVLSQETEVEGWSAKLHELAELTDCEQLLSVCARIYVDRAPSFVRLHKLCDQLLGEDLSLDKESSVATLSAIKGLKAV